MNLQKSKSKAKYLTELTRIPHVVTCTNGVYSVFMAKSWNGEIIKKYEAKDIPKLRNTSGKKVLQNTGDKQPEIPSGE